MNNFLELGLRLYSLTIVRK